MKGKLKRATLGGKKYELDKKVTFGMYVQTYVFKGFCGLCQGKVRAMLDENLKPKDEQIGIELMKTNPMHSE